MEEKKQQFDIELNRDVAQGTYSNLSIISHSSSEFIIDFIRIMPGMPKAEVKSRIILTRRDKLDNFRFNDFRF